MLQKKITTLLLLVIIISGCTSQINRSSETPVELTPFATRTAYQLPTPSISPTLEPPPVSELPTQITHVVKKGEDMGGIATMYGVKIKDLKAANASIDPRMIPIGTVLIIPSGNPEQDANKPTSIPTPGVIVSTGAPICYADPSGGAWCLIKVENTGGASVEDISVDFVLSGPGDEPETRAAFGLLDRLPDKATMPLAVYFPKAPNQPWQIGTRLRTCNPVINEKSRYLVSTVEKSKIELAADRLSAHVSGAINLQANQPDANIIQAVGAAYDSYGQPVGIRRWDSTVGLESGSSLVYDLTIYSLGGPIDRVEVLGETRPK